MRRGPARRRSAPGELASFSVVIPARNASETIATPLASLLGQTHPGWEAIVVDNGSTDGTSERAVAVTRNDPRVRVVQAPAAGVSAARNRGLTEARHEFVLFLDADDHIAPDTLRRAAEHLRASPQAVGVRYDWALESVTNHRLSMTAWDLAPDGRNLFDIGLRHCPLAIHACILRTDVVRQVGGFDESLVAAEDWDLWQRIGRLGRPLAYERDELAFYALRPKSATRTDLGRVMGDYLLVIDRQAQPDPRVEWPQGNGVTGGEPWQIAHAKTKAFLWALGMGIGAGADIDPVFDVYPNPGRGSVDPELAASQLANVTPIGRGLLPRDWAQLWPSIAARVGEALTQLAAWDGDPALAPRILRRLEVKVLVAAGGALTGAGETACAEVDLAQPVVAQQCHGSSRLVALVRHGEVALGWVELPVLDGTVSGDDLRVAIDEQLGAAASRALARHPATAARLVAGAARAGTERSFWRPIVATRARSARHARRELAAVSRHVARASFRRGVLGARTVEPPPELLIGPSREQPTGARHTVTRDLPVLMYHRIATTGPDALANYRLAADDFGEQLEWLRRHGYESVGLHEWAASLRTGRPLPGRRVALTFDDGYVDFADAAVPLLLEYGYSACVFVVTAKAGGVSDWDADHGVAPLMDWAQLRDVRARGMEVGSHTHQHRHLTALTPAQAIESERHARSLLAHELGIVDPVLAYPYGDIDSAQRMAMARAGYSCAVTTRHAVSSRFDHPMSIARLEVVGGTGIAEFAGLFGAP